MHKHLLLVPQVADINHILVDNGSRPSEAHDPTFCANHPQVATVVKWAERLGDALLDGNPGVAAAGAAAVALLLTAAAGLAPDGTVAPGAKAVLPPEAAVRPDFSHALRGIEADHFIVSVRHTCRK